VEPRNMSVAVIGAGDHIGAAIAKKLSLADPSSPPWSPHFLPIRLLPDPSQPFSLSGWNVASCLDSDLGVSEPKQPN
jgi:hypothetical protein